MIIHNLCILSMTIPCGSGAGAPDGPPLLQIGPQKPLLIIKGGDRGTDGFESRLVLGPGHTNVVVVPG